VITNVRMIVSFGVALMGGYLTGQTG
jgi:hypothetical protein